MFLQVTIPKHISEFSPITIVLHNLNLNLLRYYPEVQWLSYHLLAIALSTFQFQEFPVAMIFYFRLSKSTYISLDFQNLRLNQMAGWSLRYQMIQDGHLGNFENPVTNQHILY